MVIHYNLNSRIKTNPFSTKKTHKPGVVVPTHSLTMKSKENKSGYQKQNRNARMIPLPRNTHIKQKNYDMT